MPGVEGARRDRDPARGAAGALTRGRARARRAGSRRNERSPRAGRGGRRRRRHRPRRRLPARPRRPLVRADLAGALDARGEPLVSRIRRWRPGIPQYELGHTRFVELARAIEADLPGLVLAGSYLGGVSVPDRVAEAERAAGTDPVP
jgi:hypothetical protein